MRLSRIERFTCFVSRFLKNKKAPEIFRLPAPFLKALLRMPLRRAGGDKRDRTVDPLLAKQVLSQLSYAPICHWWVLMDSNHRPPPYQDDALTS